MAAAKRWILSLALDDTIRWAAAEIDARGGIRVESLRSSKPLRALPETKPEDLATVIRDALRKLKGVNIEHDRMFSRVRAVGVSCPGIIDTTSGRLLNIDRKRWLPRPTGDRGYIVDFKELLAGSIFPNVEPTHVCVHNDVTAKCLAEWEAQRGNARPADGIKSLWYLNLHRGINASVMAPNENARALGALPALQGGMRSLLHHEMGHQTLRPDPEDQDGKIYSACPVHTYCFTGLAGGNRALRQWGHMLPSLDRSSSESASRAWHFLPRYMAAFVYNALLTTQVDRVVLAGGMVTPAIIRLIDAHLRRMNAYEGRPYVDFASLASPSFLSAAKLHIEIAGVLGGLALARRFLMDPLTPPVTSFMSAV